MDNQAFELQLRFTRYYKAYSAALNKLFIKNAPIEEELQVLIRRFDDIHSELLKNLESLEMVTAFKKATPQLPESLKIMDKQALENGLEDVRSGINQLLYEYASSENALNAQGRNELRKATLHQANSEFAMVLKALDLESIPSEETE